MEAFIIPCMFIVFTVIFLSLCAIEWAKKKSETTFEESKILYDFFQEQEQQQKDIDLIKISDMIDKNVRKFNYKQWYLR